MPSCDNRRNCPCLLLSISNMFVWFPVSDYYQLGELLTPEENNLLIKTRQFMENEVAPIAPKVHLCLVRSIGLYDLYWCLIFLLWVPLIVLGDIRIPVASHSKAGFSRFPWRHHQGTNILVYLQWHICIVVVLGCVGVLVHCIQAESFLDSCTPFFFLYLK